MPSNPLTKVERTEIHVGIAFGSSNRVIAEALGRSPSTIWREIARNGGREVYCPFAAQARAEACLARPKVPKLVADPELGAHVAERLGAKDSPMTISIELARGVWPITAKISHETIYQAIYAGDQILAQADPPTEHKSPHLGRAERKHRGQPTPNTNSLGQYRPISERPPEALERCEVGHLEGDLIVGAHNRSALITLVDRLTRYLWLISISSKTADALYDALVPVLLQIPPQYRRSLTWDQGAEMARHKDIATAAGIDIYIADAKAPWQRPSNENINAIVRRYVGKGTDLSLYDHSDLQLIQYRINTIPRRILGWDTAHDHYTQAIAMIG